jgi:DNA-binding response OmpR family regulator
VSSEYHNIEELNERGKNLLFISGNRYESRILSLALERSGYAVVFASDLNQLAKLISETDTKPDFIIYMDDSEEILPENLIDIYTAKQINIPVIMISDRNQLRSSEKLVNSGIVKQQLTKPVSLKEIHNAIQLSLK